MPLTLAEIDALLPDNTAGDISPADHRATMEAVYGGDVFLTHETPPASGWSWVNQGSAAVADLDNGGILLSGPVGGTNNLTARVRSVTAPITVTARIDCMTVSTNGGQGLCARESSTGELVVMYISRNGAVTVENWNSPTSFSSQQVNSGVFPNQPYWFQLEDNATNLLFRMSASGAPGSYILIGSLGRTAWMAGGPDQLGWVIRDHNQAFTSVLSSWSQA